MHEYGSNSPVASLAQVLRSSASLGTSQNSSASSTPVGTPRGDHPSRRSSTASTSSTSLSTPHGTPPRTTSLLPRKDSRGSKDSTPTSTPRVSSSLVSASQPIDIPPSKKPNNSQPTSPEGTPPTLAPAPPKRKESIGAMNPPLLQRRDSSHTREQILDRKRLSQDNEFTIFDIIAFTFYNKTWISLQKENKCTELFMLMALLGYTTEQSSTILFRTRAEACTNLRESMLSPMPIKAQDFQHHLPSISFLMTPRIVIVDPGKTKYQELKKSVETFFQDANFTPREIILIQTNSSSNLNQLRKDFETQLALSNTLTLTDGSDYNNLQERLLADYPEDFFLIVSSDKYAKGISSTLPRFAVYDTHLNIKTPITIEQTRRLASTIYFDHILTFLEHNSLSSAKESSI